jgi:Ran GTPase-activating protein (RanGAP) involved in mRNA processing and transport
MYNDTVLKKEGMNVLATYLGPVKAERFISLIIREPFDYTEWQRDLFKDVSLNDFLKDAMDFRLGQIEVEHHTE